MNIFKEYIFHECTNISTNISIVCRVKKPILTDRIASDRSGLVNSEKVEALQEPFLEAFRHYVRRRRVSQPHIFAKMIFKLTDLRSISVKGRHSLHCILNIYLLLKTIGSLNKGTMFNSMLFCCRC